MNAFRFLVVVSVLFFAQSLMARDLSYKFSTGYRQVYTSAKVPKNTKDGTPYQVNGVEFTYGVAKDLQIGGYAGFNEGFDFVMMGPTFRYDIQRLINREASIWQHLNLFTEIKFLAKMGGESESGITIHAPYIGAEIFPFAENNFAISSSAGLVIDFVKDNKLGFTNAMLGDLGLRYYF